MALFDRRIGLYTAGVAMSSRRDFLKSSGLVIMAGAAGYLTADQFVNAQFVNYGAEKKAGSGDSRQRPTLVTIFLRGGADAVNAIVPYGDPLYYQYRTHIALHADGAGKGKGRGEKGVIPLNNSSYWGVNAGMEPLVPLLESGVAVPIINVGSPDGTRSHFTAQDYMERGAPGNSGVTTGWLNRYLEKTKKPFDAPLRGLTAENLVPRALRGSYPVLAGNNRTEQMDSLRRSLFPQEPRQHDRPDGAQRPEGRHALTIPTPRTRRTRPHQRHDPRHHRRFGRQLRRTHQGP